MGEELRTSGYFTRDEVAELVDEGFGDDLTDAQASAIGAAIEGSFGAYFLINYIVFNPVKDEIDQALNPLEG